jgi:glycosyltransferase involved in cell wall biosynthesis
MKILMINNFLNTAGGTEAIFWREVALLKEAGHEVKAWGTDKSLPTSETGLYEETILYDCLLPYIEKRQISLMQKLMLFAKLFYQPLTEPLLLKALHAFQPDVIHVHNWQYHITGSLWATLKKHAPAIPVVYTVHDTRLICPSGKFNPSKSTSQSCQQGGLLACIKKPCKNNSIGETGFGLLDNLWQKFLPINAVVSQYLLPSQSLCSILTHTTQKLPTSKTTVLLNALDNAFFATQPEAFTPIELLKPNLLYVGRLSEEKGVHVLLDALSLLPEGFTLTIVGEGKEEEPLKQQARRLGIGNRVFFLGKKTAAEVIDLFKSHWVSVLPCLWFEIFGLTVAESMAVGCPVIASNLGAMPELLGDDSVEEEKKGSFSWVKRGILFEPASASSLATAIETLWDNPQRYDEIRLAGWQWASSTLQVEDHISKLESIYKACLPLATST